MVTKPLRLAYKSSLESAKRDRHSSSERAQNASERELDLFPLLEIESSDVLFKVRSCQTINSMHSCHYSHFNASLETSTIALFTVNSAHLNYNEI